MGIARGLSIAATLAAAALLVSGPESASAFGGSGVGAPAAAQGRAAAAFHRRPAAVHPGRTGELRMSDSGGGGGGGERQKSKKKGISVIVKERTEAKMEEKQKKEEMWRGILHNDEINTFQHVTRAITTVVTTLDRKRAFDICMETHGIGKSTVTKSWKKKAEQYCLSLQRQGLTVSIAPDKAFGGGGGGGDGDGGGDGGGGGGGGGPDMS